MFTGIIEEKGKILKTSKSFAGKQLVIETNKICNDLKIGDSVAVNGVCQTVVEINSNKFTVDTVSETLKKTTLSELQTGNIVNLETALKPTTRIGGHFVQGHIDTCGIIQKITKLQNSAEFFFAFPNNFRKYLAQTGSICIDGVSLTTAEIFDASFKVALIPHTLNSTIFCNYKIGDKVNLEFDIIGKYIESIFLFGSNFNSGNYNKNSKILNNFINQPDF